MYFIILLPFNTASILYFSITKPHHFVNKDFELLKGVEKLKLSMKIKMFNLVFQLLNLTNGINSLLLISMSLNLQIFFRWDFILKQYGY